MKIKLILASLLVIFLVLFIFRGVILDVDDVKNSGVTSHQLMQSVDGSVHNYKLGNQQFLFEVVNSSASKTQGLSGRNEIGADGMLFAFEQTAAHSIWMKEMKLDLDLIWLIDGEVVDITLGAKKPSQETQLHELEIYQPKTGVNQVLEVKSGFVEKWGVKEGDLLKIM